MEETWHAARLIPTSGIGGADEQERRATSALLAVMGVVPDFAKALLSPLGAPVRKVECFIEVPFQLGDKKVIPDGLIRVTRGSKQWVALVEVKTGKNELDADQLNNYLDVARAEGFDALITISNEISPNADQHPTAVDKRKLRKVSIHHWSWAFLLSTAIVQKEHRGVTDPEQAWILGELIRYLEHDRSGALDMDDMGPKWVTVRESVAANTLRRSDKDAPDVVARFDALIQYACLKLGQKLGTEVTPVRTRQESANPAARVTAMLTTLSDSGQLVATVKIPNAVGSVRVVADLRAGLVTYEVDLGAPQEGRQTTRVNWLLRQLKESRDDVRLESFVARSRNGQAELLAAVRDEPALLVADPAKDIHHFRVSLSVPLGSKRGRGRGSFIDSVVNGIDEFYGDVVQKLKAWAATPPRLRDAEVKESPAVLSSTALSSQDGPES